MVGIGVKFTLWDNRDRFSTSLRPISNDAEAAHR